MHFIRLIDQERSVRILNVDWPVPSGQPDQGAWATLTFAEQGATLRVYDDAPDASQRWCLARYPFPLREQVQPLRAQFQRASPARHSLLSMVTRAVSRTVRSPVASWLSTML